MKTFTMSFFILILFVADNHGQSYCYAKGINSNPRFVDGVELGHELAMTGNNFGYSNHYTKFDITRGECAHLLLYSSSTDGNSNDFHTAVWIDFNNDGDFTDPGESMYSSNAFYGSAHVHIPIPATASLGLTRMRIIMSQEGAPSSCGTIPIGEVEDHSVYIHSGDYYCSTKGSSTFYEWINRVQLITSATTGNNNGYANYTCDVPGGQHLIGTKGQYNTFRFTPGYNGGPYPERWRVWIDFNNDNDFNDPGEFIIDTVWTGEVVYTLYFNNGPAQTARCRISMNWGTEQPGPCGNFKWGEAEDHLIVLHASSSLTGDETGLVSKGKNDLQETHDLFGSASKLHNPFPKLSNEEFKAWTAGDNIVADVNLREDMVGKLILSDVNGRIVSEQPLNGNFSYEFTTPNIPGIYIVGLVTKHSMVSRKCFVGQKNN